MNWLLMPPGTVYSPGTRQPSARRPAFSRRRVRPCSRQRSSYTDSGRERSVSLPSSRMGFPESRHSGIMKRSVLPDSRQRSTAGPAFRGSQPRIRTSSPFQVREAPSAARQSAVARMSSLRSTPRTVLSPSARAAQISRRCAMDLEGGAATVPRAVPGRISTFMNGLQSDNPWLPGSRRSHVL